MKKRNKSVKVIGCWMILAGLAGVYSYTQMGLGKLTLSIPTAELAFYGLTILAALGLLWNKEWARKLSVLLFIVYFFWTVYVVYFITGPSLKFLIDEYSQSFAVPPVVLKTTLATILITYIFWPVFVVLFLTHPRVKFVFNPSLNNEEEDRVRNPM